MTPEAMADSDSDLLVSLSGGKDSTATHLHLLETGFLDRVERGRSEEHTSELQSH